MEKQTAFLWQMQSKCLLSWPCPCSKNHTTQQNVKAEVAHCKLVFFFTSDHPRPKATFHNFPRCCAKLVVAVSTWLSGSTVPIWVLLTWYFSCFTLIRASAGYFWHTVVYLVESESNDVFTYVVVKFKLKANIHQSNVRCSKPGLFNIFYLVSSVKVIPKSNQNKICHPMSPFCIKKH